MTGREISPLEKRALDYIKAEVSDNLRAHLVGTRDFALEINRVQSLGLDGERIALAALCHDLTREHTEEQLLEGLRSRGIDPESFDCVAPVLLHAPLSAEIARGEIGVKDEAVLQAILRHATGTEDMTPLDKLIYVADKVEPTRDWPGVEELRALAHTDLQAAFPRVIASTIKYVVAHLLPLDYNSVAAYNQALTGVEPRLKD